MDLSNHYEHTRKIPNNIYKDNEINIHCVDGRVREPHHPAVQKNRLNNSPPLPDNGSFLTNFDNFFRFLCRSPMIAFQNSNSHRRFQIFLSFLITLILIRIYNPTEKYIFLFIINKIIPIK